MSYVLTADLDASFVPKLEEVARDLSTVEGVCNPLHLASVMKSESDVRANAWNNNPKNLPPEKRWNASGLIQFMPATLPGVGWTMGHAAFRELSATEQLPYVRRYFSPHRGLLTSIGAIYTATFLPALLPHAGDPNFVLTAKNGPLGWAYSPNACFDANNDLAITVGELEQAVLRNCRGARWAEIVQRLGGTLDDSELPSEGFDLRTTLGVQRALARLGFNPGTIDGAPGPHTSAAILDYQTSKGKALVHDGVFGPLTREAMRIDLMTRA